MSSRALPLLALLIAVGIFFTYIKPTWQGPIAVTKAAIASDNAALEAAKRYKAQENVLASARAQIDPENLARLSLFLPDSVDNVGLILDLSALAARSQLALQNINVITSNGTTATGATPTTRSGGTGAPTVAGGTARANLVGSVDLSTSVVGTYSAFQTFLAAIEKSARLLDVRELTVKGSDTGVYTYQMTLRLYWLR
jgi:hypothetical protein